MYYTDTLSAVLFREPAGECTFEQARRPAGGRSLTSDDEQHPAGEKPHLGRLQGLTSAPFSKSRLTKYIYNPNHVGLDGYNPPTRSASAGSVRTDGYLTRRKECRIGKSKGTHAGCTCRDKPVSAQPARLLVDATARPRHKLDGTSLRRGVAESRP